MYNINIYNVYYVVDLCISCLFFNKITDYVCVNITKIHENEIILKIWTENILNKELGINK